MASYNIGVVVGQGLEPTAFSLVEFRDSRATRSKPRTFAVREVVDTRTLTPGLSIASSIQHVAEIAAPLGPDARVIVNVAGSPELTRLFREAYREGMFARSPLAVTVTAGDTLPADNAVSAMELILSLTEMVKVRGFAFAERTTGVESLIKEAIHAETQQTATGKVGLVPHQPTGRLIALALALYPRLHPTHEARRYETPPLPHYPATVWDSYAAAVAKLNSAADA